MDDNMIPDALEYWVVAYEKVKANEYKFYLKNLPIKSVSIKVLKHHNFSFYRAVTNLMIKKSETGQFYLPSGKSQDPQCAVITALSRFILESHLHSYEENKNYLTDAN